MPAYQRPRPRAKAALLSTTLVDGNPVAVGRLIDNASKSISALEDKTVDASNVTATLVAGANVINHGLGRAPTTVHVTLSAPDATFSAALTTADSKQATVTTVGGTATNARLEFS